MFKVFSAIFLMIISLSCGEDKMAAEAKIPAQDQDTITVVVDTVYEELKITTLEQCLIDVGLVNIKDLNKEILVDLRYSTTNNFFKQDVYGDFDQCYLQPDVAQKLVNAQEYLKTIDSTCTLLVYDAVRPRSVQKILWESLNLSFAERIKYVSNPKNGSIHNYGAAVDLTIAKINGDTLNMGTEYDFFGEEAYPIKEVQLLKAGRLTQENIENRELLRKVMRHGGFTGIQSEWWHFNSCSRPEARRLYKIVE